MDSISFKAKFVNNSVIKSRNINGKYENLQTSIVKINNTNSDKKAIREVANLWDEKELTFVNMIIVSFFNNPHKSLYALTKQSSNYNKLNPHEILGILEASQENNSCMLNYLQTRPDCINSKRKKPYKGIGKAMMDSFMNSTKSKKIYLRSVYEAIGFYKKLGFKVQQQDVTCPLMFFEKQV